MLETQELALGKARFSDWKEMYRAVWSQPESAKYMYWTVSPSRRAAKQRMRRTMQFQAEHDAFLVYEKSSGKPIGFAGAAEVIPGVWTETGICLGPAYVGRGYGKQVLGMLLEYCRTVRGAKEFRYSTREENEPSKRLALSMGFRPFSSEQVTNHKGTYRLLHYRKMIG